MASETARQLYPYPPEEPGNLRTAQRQLGDVAALLHDTGADVDDGALLLDQSWDSDSAATAVSDVRVLARVLPADGTQLGTASTSTGRYVRALEDAREAIDAIRTRYDAAVTARDEANADVPEAIRTNRYEREELRRVNQQALTSAKAGLDADYDDTLAGLAATRTSVAHDLTGVLDTLAPKEYRSPDGGYGQAAFLGAAAAMSLVMPVDGAEDPMRRAAQARAFEDAVGRPPSGAVEWRTAAALDPTSYLEKNGDMAAVIQVGRITPQPGQGIVRIALYIPSEEVFNVPNYDLGDNRGPDSDFDPEDARVSLFIDYETGLVIARQNPSVDTEGTVRVSAPDVRVSQTPGGAVRIEYDAMNPFAPPDPTDSHTVRGDVVVTPPGTDGEWGLDGEIGDYPAFEVYHDDPLGRTQELLTDSADNEGLYGPLVELPGHHDVGGGPDSDALKQFGDLGRPITGDLYEYTPRNGVPLGPGDAPVTIDPWPPFGRDEPEGGYV